MSHGQRQFLILMEHITVLQATRVMFELITCIILMDSMMLLR